MEAQYLLDDLQARGFKLAADGDKLVVKPGTALTADDSTAIRDHKLALLELVRPRFCEPYITDLGELRIPFNSHPRYHWWNGGQSIVTTLVELDAPSDIWRLYVARGAHLLTPKHADICTGTIQRIGVIVYCAECKYFMEE